MFRVAHGCFADNLYMKACLYGGGTPTKRLHAKVKKLSIRLFTSLQFSHCQFKFFLGKSVKVHQNQSNQ